MLHSVPDKQNLIKTCYCHCDITLSLLRNTSSDSFAGINALSVYERLSGSRLILFLTDLSFMKNILSDKKVLNLPQARRKKKTSAFSLGRPDRL